MAAYDPSDMRLQVLQAHLRNAHANERSGVEMQATAATVEDSPQEYSVVLPETLSNPGLWTVRRYRPVSMAPVRLLLSV